MQSKTGVLASVLIVISGGANGYFSNQTHQDIARMRQEVQTVSHGVDKIDGQLGILKWRVSNLEDRDHGNGTR